jgi:hypothetical protein
MGLLDMLRRRRAERLDPADYWQLLATPAKGRNEERHAADVDEAMARVGKTIDDVEDDQALLERLVAAGDLEEHARRVDRETAQLREKGMALRKEADDCERRSREARTQADAALGQIGVLRDQLAARQGEREQCLRALAERGCPQAVAQQLVRATVGAK